MPMVAMFVAIFIHIFLCYLFVNVLEMDIIGLAYAQSIQCGLLALSVAIYCNCSEKISKSLAPLSRESFNGWKQYLQISLPNTIMICSEWWAFEVLTILAGVIGVTELASQTILISILATMFMMPLGISEASGGLIGNCIGSGNVDLARRFFSIINKFTTILIIL